MSVAQPEIRGSLSQGLRIDGGGSGADRNLVRPLQPQAPASGAESPDSGPGVLVDTPDGSFCGMMGTGKQFKGVGTADRPTPTSTPRFITYKPQGTVRTTPTTSNCSSTCHEFRKHVAHDRGNCHVRSFPCWDR